jgi:hypothetical protein
LLSTTARSIDWSVQKEALYIQSFDTKTNAPADVVDEDVAYGLGRLTCVQELDLFWRVGVYIRRQGESFHRCIYERGKKDDGVTTQGAPAFFHR